MSYTFYDYELSPEEDGNPEHYALRANGEPLSFGYVTIEFEPSLMQHAVFMWREGYACSHVAFFNSFQKAADHGVNWAVSQWTRSAA